MDRTARTLGGAADAFRWDSGSIGRRCAIGYLKSEFDPPEPLKLAEAKPNETAEEKKKREDANARRRLRGRGAITTGAMSWLRWTSCARWA